MMDREQHYRRQTSVASSYLPPNPIHRRDGTRVSFQENARSARGDPVAFLSQTSTAEGAAAADDPEFEVMLLPGVLTSASASVLFLLAVAAIGTQV